MKFVKGFTIIEILVVIGIIMIIAGILFPVLKQATLGAKISASSSNLHQQHVAFKIYQSEYEGDGVYSVWNEMGYPPPDSDWPRMLDKSLSIWSSPCGCHPDWPCPVTITYKYFWPSTERPFAAAFGENLVLFTDEHCNASDIRLTNTFDDRRGIGVFLSGQAKSFIKRGDMRKFSWWSKPDYPVIE